MIKMVIDQHNINIYLIIRQVQVQSLSNYTYMDDLVINE